MNRTDSNTFFFARQPILDRKGKIVAYELLYRSGDTGCATCLPQNATAQVVINALNLTGLSNLLQNENKAFINIDEQMLFDDTLHSVPKEHFILELLETIAFNDKSLQRIKALHAEGFRFALDDVVCSEEVIASIEPVLPYIDIIKLELPQEAGGLVSHIARFKKMNLTVLAEKVESDECHQMMHALGCDLFQGYYFAKPTVVSGQKLDTSLAVIFRVVALLTQNRIDEALRVFEQDAALTIQLLRYMNSAAFCFRSNIKSIRHAVMLLGSNHLKQWLTLISYAMGSDEGIHSPLLKLAQERSNMMHLLAKECLTHEHHEDAAFIGLLSLLEALFRRPLEEVLKELHIDDHLQGILLYRSGPIGQIFELVLAIEIFEQNEIQGLLQDLKLDFKTFVKIVEESYRITEEFQQCLASLGD